MHREAVYKMQELVLLERSKEFISYQYRKLIKYLPSSRKLFLVLSIIAPQILKKLYIRHLEYNNNKWLKNRG